MEVMELLTQAVEQNAADIFLVPGMPFSYKIGGRIICQGEEKIMPDQLDQMITRIYEIAKNRSMERVLSHGDDDFSFAIPGGDYPPVVLDMACSVYQGSTFGELSIEAYEEQGSQL